MVVAANIRTNSRTNRRASSRKTTPKKKPKRAVVGAAQVGVRNKPLSTLTDEALHSYFANLNGHKPGELYQLVMGEVEKPLFKAVLGK